METMYDNTKKSRLTNTTKENYFQNKEKQELISFIKNKIKEYKLCFPEIVKALQEVLDFVNKGAKDE